MTTARVDPLNVLLTAHPVPTWRRIAWPIMALIVLGLGWANFAKLDEVAVAPGEVIPLGKSKVIQHLEGGIVQDIYVKEGDTVSKGQTLLQLDLGSGGTNIQELQVRLDSALLTRARLEAESKGKKEPSFPADIVAKQPEQAVSQRQAFDARKRQLAAGLSVLHALVQQRKQDVQEMNARLRTARKNLVLIKERFKISTNLLKESLTSRVDHLQLGAKVESLQGDIQTTQAGIPRARATVAEAKQRIQENTTRFRREAQDELNKTEQAIGRIRELLKKAEEQGVRAEIKSPIDGVVINLAFTTVGNVIKPGEAIMEIVPTGKNLVIESRLRPTDRGYVTVGQRATIKVSTYNYSTYGGLDGTVISVAADTSLDQKRRAYFRVVVKPKKTYLGKKPGELPILPGMQTTINIHTGQRTVMNYMIKPVLKLKNEAFRER